MPEPSKLDLYQTITDRIVAALESGPDKVSLPWHRTGACSILPRNAFTGHAYNGINVLSLWATAEERQYPRSLWATYRQWLGLDEHLFRAQGYKRTEDWYSVLTHELGHWSGAEKRLNRDLRNRFGDEAYAMEELVAELTSAFLCADLGISVAPRPDHAAYIANWLKVLKSDKRAVFTAAAKASEAAKYLAGFATA